MNYDEIIMELEKRRRNCYLKANTYWGDHSSFITAEAHGMGVAYRECIELLGGTPIPIKRLQKELR